MSTPVIRELHKIYPDAEIDMLTTPVTSALFQYNPYIRKRFTFYKKKPIHKLFNFLSLMIKLRKEKYDLSVSLQKSVTSGLLLFFAGIRRRIGYKEQILTTHSIKPSSNLHRREQDLSLISILTKKPLNSETELFFSEKETNKAKQFINQFVSKNEIPIGIAPGSVRRTKMWPEEYYAELVQRLANEQVFIFFLGGADERNLCQRIIKKSGNKKTKNLAGQLTLLESSALIKEFDLLITNDSAPLHMANAVKTDVFAFFGPTVREFGCYPFREHDKIFEIELDCRPCSAHGGKKCPLDHHNCMRLIKPIDVFQAVREHLKLTEMKTNHSPTLRAEK